MKTVNEVSIITGVSVRTLHYYDSIGLLLPAAVTEAGYRLYDDKALARLQSILFFRELEFPLKEIKAILDDPDFDQRDALERQIKLLKLKQKRLGELISLARTNLELLDSSEERQGEKGENSMDFTAFDKTEIERYTDEAKRKWGGTKAYLEYESKWADRTDAEKRTAADRLMQRFAAFGGIKHLAPDSLEAQTEVEALRSFISENYYDCTPEILGGLGRMYVSDERFRRNIDAYGGDGTAEFVSKAIGAYCER